MIKGKSYLITLALICQSAAGSEAVTKMPDNTPSSAAEDISLHHIDALNIHDPAILADPVTQTYYVYDGYDPKAGFENKKIKQGERAGVEAYWSKDLINWQGPKLVYQIDQNSWAQADQSPWAPEVAYYQGQYYLFATLHNYKNIFHKPDGRPAIFQRGTQIFVSDNPLGPFKPISDTSQTPQNEMALDGTLWVEDGQPWMIYCQEWIQTGDGLFKAVRLSKDLSTPIGKPITLFSAADAQWAANYSKFVEHEIRASVSDGPWPYKTKDGRLLLIWSSWNKDKSQAYTTSVAYSDNGKLTGNWLQRERPLIADDRGHGNIFKTFDGELRLALHRYFKQPNTRLQIFKLEDTGLDIQIIKQLYGHQ